MDFGAIARTLAEGLYGEDWDAERKRKSDLESAALDRELATRRADLDDKRFGLDEEAAARQRETHPLTVAALEEANRQSQGGPTAREKFTAEENHRNQMIKLQQQAMAARAAGDEAQAKRFEAELAERRRSIDLQEGAMWDRQEQFQSQLERDEYKRAETLFNYQLELLDDQLRSGEIGEAEYASQKAILMDQFAKQTGQELLDISPGETEQKPHKPLRPGFLAGLN